MKNHGVTIDDYVGTFDNEQRCKFICEIFLYSYC